jgi:hypothetical protein
MGYTVTTLETASIQPYIFGSNELRENIGASHLAHLATTTWVFEQLTTQGERHNVQGYQNKRRSFTYTNQQIETPDNSLTVELIYAGGGNTILLFKGDNSLERAKDFVYKLSRKVLHDTPGMNLYAGHQAYQWGENLALAVRQAREMMGRYKKERPINLSLLGLGVTAACTSTGLPANGRHPDESKENSLSDLANRQVGRKWEASKNALDRLRGFFPDIETKYHFKWTNDLDKIGTLPEQNKRYIGVVHADGNGMGQRFIRLGQLFETYLQPHPRAYIKAMRQLSILSQDTAQAALEKTVYALVESLQLYAQDNDRYFHQDNELEKGFWGYLPFRPIVFGGDDVTWVCAGVWGLALAQRYLQALEEGDEIPSTQDILRRSGLDDTAWETLLHEVTQKKDAAAQETLAEPASPPYACAGVTIVKTHYPFSQAYEIAETLTKSAKSRARQVRHQQGHQDKKASALDWHYTTTGLADDLEGIRGREYVTAQGDNLIARPLVLDDRHSWRNWDNFVRVTTAFQQLWLPSRNKVLALREALRGGPPAVGQYQAVERRGNQLPRIALPEGHDLIEAEGWVRSTQPAEQVSPGQTDEFRCIYFDAIEMADLFVPLRQANGQEGGR